MRLKLSSYLFLLIAFTGLFFINFFNPLMSDDYGYSLMGFDVDKHIFHYTSWSGRLLADFISPLLLSIKSKALLSAIQSVALLLLIFIICSIAKAQGREINKGLYVSILSIYFISHPNFGQVNLWIVGSANYLWTALVYSSFIILLINYVYNNKLPWYAPLVALLAGCTNENISLAIIGLYLLVLTWKYYNERKISYLSLLTLFFLIVGAVILLGTPGNENRLMDHSFDKWRALSLAEKISLHVFHRFPEAIAKSKLGYFIALALIANCLVVKKYRFFVFNKKPTMLLVSLVFMLMAFGSNLVMAFAPAFPSRAMSGAFVFILFSISASTYHILECKKNDNLLRVVAYALSAIAVMIYIPVFISYHAISDQNDYRLYVLKNSDKNAERTVIPEYFFKTLPSRTYLFDTWTNFPAMSTYYGFKNIESYGTAFDFSVITQKPIIGPSNLSTPLGLVGIYLYGDDVFTSSVVLIEVTENERNKAEEGDTLKISLSDVFGRNREVIIKNPNYAWVNYRFFLYGELKNTIPFGINSVALEMLNKNNEIKYKNKYEL